MVCGEQVCALFNHSFNCFLQFLASYLAPRSWQSDYWVDWSCDRDTFRSAMHTFNYKCQSTRYARQSSCVASRISVGVYCYNRPLTDGVSRVARAPALIPIVRAIAHSCARDWTFSTIRWSFLVFKSSISGGKDIITRLIDKKRLKTGTYQTIY